MGKKWRGKKEMAEKYPRRGTSRVMDSFVCSLPGLGLDQSVSNIFSELPGQSLAAWLLLRREGLFFGKLIDEKQSHRN